MNDAPGALKQLQASAIFDGALPKRQRVDHAQWAQLSEEERRVWMMVGVRAIGSIPEHRAISDLVRTLGTMRYEPAVPTIARLWRECAVEPVRVACGAALREIGSTSARTALTESLHDAEHSSVFFAVAAVFDADPEAAFELFRPYFDDELVRKPGGTTIPQAVLSTFAPGSLTNEGPRWAEPRAPIWLRHDDRWVSLCVRLRRHTSLGRAARAVLRHANAKQVSAALAHAAKTEGPKILRPRSDRDAALLGRYRQGEHVAVWNEVRSYDAISGAFRDDVLDVARETMRRVRHNVDLLAERLHAEGWTALGGSLRTRPSRKDFDAMEQIEAITQTPLPPSLRAFWEIVGGIDFVWDYQRDDQAPGFALGLELPQLDPLSVDPARSSTSLFDQWADERRDVNPEIADPYRLDLAADSLHKVDISGGPPYAIELPFLGADPLFANEEHGLPFVDYLRLCLRWGGFPRLERHTHERGVQEFVRRMTEGFQPV